MIGRTWVKNVLLVLITFLFFNSKIIFAEDCYGVASPVYGFGNCGCMQDQGRCFFEGSTRGVIYNVPMGPQDCEIRNGMKQICYIQAPTPTSDYSLGTPTPIPPPITQTRAGTNADQTLPAPGSSTWSPTPTPTSTVSLEISGGASFHTSKCGLAAAGFQCCYPNLKEGAISLKGSFFDLFQGIWNTVQGFIKSNIDSYIGIGTQSMKDAAFQGGSNINLCPRSEEGHKKQRFVDLASGVWLDKIEYFDGDPDFNGQVEMSNNNELKAYSSFIKGNRTDVSTAGKDGLISAFFNQETLPTGGVEYEGKNYACFCVDPEQQRDESPKVFLDLAENSSLKNAANSFRASSNQVSDLKSRVLSERMEGVGAIEGAAKMCRNITNANERTKCQKCVSSGDENDLGGAWTAVGCIKADFSSTLQDRLFPLFISFGGLISLGCIIYASFLLQTSMGEPEKITKAQELMTSCIAGLIMIIFSVFILRVIGVDILRLPGLSQEVKDATRLTEVYNVYSLTPVITDISAPTVPAPTLASVNPAISSTNSVTPVPPTGTNSIQNSITTTGPTITPTPTSNPTPTPTPVPTTLAKYECGDDNDPLPNEVYLYDDIDYQGACLRLDGGENNLAYVKNSKTNSFLSNVFGACNSSYNDCIASFKVGKNVKAVFYTDAIGDVKLDSLKDFKSFTQNYESFYSNPPFNDRTSAVLIYPR